MSYKMQQGPDAENQRWKHGKASAGSTAPAGSELTALRIQMNQLEMTMNYGGPSEICGAIDAMESALHELRELVTLHPVNDNR